MKFPVPVWPRLLPTPTVLGVATLGPIGTRLSAPGTWGSVAGLLYFTVVQAGSSPAANFILNGLILYLAVALCGEAEVRLHRKDPGEVILDELAAMPLCFIGWRYLIDAWPAWAVFLSGFALFRLFDIAKPLGIKRLQNLPGGWGVVADDVAAALCTASCLHLAHALW